MNYDLTISVGEIYYTKTKIRETTTGRYIALYTNIYQYDYHGNIV